MSWFYYGPYVSVAERRKKAEEKIKSLRKRGKDVAPVTIVGRKIATTFWGNAWCKHLESFHDYENRLSRGRSYVRNGFVLDLKISQGIIEAQVMGTSLYTVKIKVTALAKSQWKKVVAECFGKIDSLVELLQGTFSHSVMEVVTNPKGGLFPQSGAITFTCSCPDYARMCKHVAAVLYGVGARLDYSPEELFVLRHVDHRELVGVASDKIFAAVKSKTREKAEEDALFNLFDIDIENQQKPVVKRKTKKRKKRVEL